MKYLMVIGLIAMTAVCAAAEEGWISLFDGETLEGWKANEAPETWSVVDGAIVASGPVSHLFYVGPDGDAQFGNFELKAKVKTSKNTNSGIFFRQPWQDSGWLQKGMEAQMQNSGKNKCYTGGLWIHAMREEPSPVPDDEWYDVHIIADGEVITVKINGETTTEYDLSKEPKKGLAKRTAREGFICLQGHGKSHRPQFKDIKLRVLANND